MRFTAEGLLPMERRKFFFFISIIACNICSGSSTSRFTFPYLYVVSGRAVGDGRRPVAIQPEPAPVADYTRYPTAGERRPPGSAADRREVRLGRTKP